MPVLVVQRGHCYRKTGATGTTGEQDYATRVADACERLLSGRGGWTVRKILADDALNLYAGDAFVAVHCDGSTNASARGASVGYRTPEGQTFGQSWKRAYDARGWDGFRPDNYTTALAQYYGTGNAVSRGNRRAIIVECGFLTSPDDRALLNAPGGPERVALSIGDALGIPVTPLEDNDMTPDEFLNTKVKWFNGQEVPIKDILAENYIASRGLNGRAAFDGETGVVQLPPLVAIQTGVNGLVDDEARVIAEMRATKGDLMIAMASIDGSWSQEQAAELAEMLNVHLSGAYTVSITPVASPTE